MNQTDYFIRDSDNILSMTLTEDGDAILVTPTEIDIIFGDSVVVINRTPDGNGIAYSGGVLEITPSGLTEDLSDLIAGHLYKMKFVIKTNEDLAGVVYGGNDSVNKQFFLVSDSPV